MAQVPKMVDGSVGCGTGQLERGAGRVRRRRDEDRPVTKIVRIATNQNSRGAIRDRRMHEAEVSLAPSLSTCAVDNGAGGHPSKDRRMAGALDRRREMDVLPGYFFLLRRPRRTRWVTVVLGRRLAALLGRKRPLTASRTTVVNFLGLGWAFFRPRAMGGKCPGASESKPAEVKALLAVVPAQAGLRHRYRACWSAFRAERV